MFDRSARFERIRIFSSSIVCLALLALSAIRLASGQQSQETKTIVSDKPLTAEQLAVYKAMFVSWFEDSKLSGNLAIQTEPLDLKADYWYASCLKGLLLESISPGIVHRFRTEDLNSLGSGALHLVDPEEQSEVNDEHDPGKAIRNGKPVDDAVEDGFSHGLLTVSEIRFDKTHTHALVQFSFRCGMLCGHATPMLMEKKNGMWKRKAMCGGYVS
jgi:hypothetical protein